MALPEGTTTKVTLRKVELRIEQLITAIPDRGEQVMFGENVREEGI